MAPLSQQQPPDGNTITEEDRKQIDLIKVQLKAEQREAEEKEERLRTGKDWYQVVIKEDFRDHDPPALLVKLRAALGKDGAVSVWKAMYLFGFTCWFPGGHAITISTGDGEFAEKLEIHRSGVYPQECNLPQPMSPEEVMKMAERGGGAKVDGVGREGDTCAGLLVLKAKSALDLRSLGT